ncbi:MFS transporter [Candidatus Anaplasma sp. TIGMIC]|uniref:MFS transporter n=1 Tax=Candidatus Anaplasma sp. TIGMIC TaxID=3020713 RepID=UPI00232EBAA3|nr:MFS transporter [Candidatus Anaplasma sp. TIGMIC]MDB1135103.1 MFS transporter [Candidatus Anaplasma sp. TIGMIC]
MKDSGLTSGSYSTYGQYVLWISSVLMLLSVCCFEWMYTTFGKVALGSDIKIALLLFTHMCFFSIFQLFSGVLVDHYGSRLMLPIAALFVFVGMLLQIHTHEHNFPLMVIISQSFLTFGSSFGFIGIGYLSYGFFRKSLAGVMFGIAQMMYSIFYSLSWYVSVYYDAFLKFNFSFIVWSVAVFQFIVSVMILCTARDPEAYEFRGGSIGFLETVRSIVRVTTMPNVLTISLIGGMEFGLFFSVAGVLLHKTNGEIGTVASVYAWVGFALGSPCACFLYSLLRKGREYIFSVSGLMQGLSLLCLMMLPIQDGIVAGGFVWDNSFYYLLTALFGFFSGGHMIAFTLGSDMALAGALTTYCAIVNGFMCLLSGAIVLGLTALARYHSLADLLLVTAIIAVLYYGLLGLVLHSKAARSKLC